MAKTHLLGPWIRRFLLEYVVNERNLARNTQLTRSSSFFRLTSQACSA
jgi:integrase/recombinase XerD